MKTPTNEQRQKFKNAPEGQAILAKCAALAYELQVAEKDYDAWVIEQIRKESV
jgi:hypothetical protein